MIRVLTAFACLYSIAGAEVDAGRLADAIRARENFHGRDGAHGERGPYQITAAMWALQMPGRPFSEARRETPSRLCTLREIARLERELRRRSVDASVFNIALAWNAGLEGSTRGAAPVRAYWYAAWVDQLYRSQ